MFYINQTFQYSHRVGHKIQMIVKLKKLSVQIEKFPFTRADKKKTPAIEFGCFCVALDCFMFWLMESELEWWMNKNTILKGELGMH